ncbi:hypothetical protein [Amycolatopsis sp. PS_44_ISF1]|uniref:hypothetical protein n=1 Tax=Amycolatopsis sp. PS_44_ISF1 TaxID=2974917 RepID=UPI0028DDAF16|nr:hypothetical protein [Amycolatopsis sp. PS_44_ISF1]MDT8915871.1 hypothetical protein [Amycolatopsis sp. PS_44_ISF1]
MPQQDEQQQAAEALASVRAHQERTRRAARLPWWVYAVVFVVTAGGSAATDFISLSGAKLVAVLVIVALVAAFVAGRYERSSLLGRARGVQQRQPFVPWVFGVVLAVGVLGAWLIARYGTGFAHRLADSAGLGQYPNTVVGVVYGVAFTALFALGQGLVAASQRHARA